MGSLRTVGAWPAILSSPEIWASYEADVTNHQHGLDSAQKIYDAQVKAHAEKQQSRIATEKEEKDRAIGLVRTLFEMPGITYTSVQIALKVHEVHPTVGPRGFGRDFTISSAWVGLQNKAGLTEGRPPLLCL